MRFSHIASLLVVIALAAAAGAAPITVANFSFENPNLNDLNNIGNVTGWTTSAANVGVFDSIDSFFSNTNGNDTPLPAPAHLGQMLFTNNINGVGQASQVVGTVAGGAQYTLTVAVGRAKTGAGFGTYLIELLAGSNVMATANSVIPTVDTFTDVSATVSSAVSAAFNGQTMSILIMQNDVNSSISGVQKQNFYDNVRLEVLPEPASVSCMAIGAGGLVMKRRRR
jgi:hypothetical protein